MVVSWRGRRRNDEKLYLVCLLYNFIRSLDLYGTPNYVLEIIIRIIWWRRMNVYMFRRVLSIEAIKRVNNLLIQYVIVLVPVECGSLWF